MLAVTREEGVDSECGLLTAAGRRSLRKTLGEETVTTQEHRNIRHVLVLRVLVQCSGQPSMLVAPTCATGVVGRKRDRTTYTMWLTIPSSSNRLLGGINCSRCQSRHVCPFNIVFRIRSTLNRATKTRSLFQSHFVPLPPPKRHSVYTLLTNLAFHHPGSDVAPWLL